MKLKRDLFFLIIVLAVVGLLYYLSTKTKIKAMPANAVHTATQTRQDCLKCHTPEKLGALELQHKHPGKWKDERFACTLCHKPAATRAQLLKLPEAVQLARAFSR
jgi:nitrate/TMAO reductase-like tetraheme cytochrome c subunit